jgi:hypothetical protein
MLGWIGWCALANERSAFYVLRFACGVLLFARRSALFVRCDESGYSELCLRYRGVYSFREALAEAGNGVLPPQCILFADFRWCVPVTYLFKYSAMLFHSVR